MIRVTMVWDDCSLRNGEWVDEASTAYWVQVPRHDIGAVAAYAADPDAVAEAATADPSGGDDAYFLISKDLGSVVSMPEYYPISGQWNGEGPFRELGHPVEIATLQELTSLDV
jgi:hypothetical protein